MADYYWAKLHNLYSNKDWRRTILGHISETEEIAPPVWFLVSDEANYITGTGYLVDGSCSIKG